MNSRGVRITLVDVLVTTGIVALVVTLLMNWLIRMRESGGRVPCASNLRQIGLGIQMYANDNRGAFPRTIASEDANPVPTSFTGANGANAFAPGGPAPNDVTAALFLVLKTQVMSPEPFVCPQDTRAGKLKVDVSKRSNFPSRQNLSYSYINPYPSKAALDAGFELSFKLSSDFAIASDMNPGGPGMTHITPDSPREQMRLGNSNNHGGDGQDVLYADGHVEFQFTPFCGMLRPAPRGGAVRDNIFTAGGPNPRDPAGPAPVIQSGSLDELDSVLLPVATEGPSPIRPMPRGASAVLAGVTAGLVVIALWGVVYAWQWARAGRTTRPAA